MVDTSTACHVCTSTLVSINLHTKLEVPSFTYSIDIIGEPKLNKSLLPLTDPRDAVPRAHRAVQMSTVSVINC